ncbi:PDZ_3 domain-containing protein, partial [Haematococcus lacustris]
GPPPRLLVRPAAGGVGSSTAAAGARVCCGLLHRRLHAVCDVRSNFPHGAGGVQPQRPQPHGAAGAEAGRQRGQQAQQRTGDTASSWGWGWEGVLTQQQWLTDGGAVGSGPAAPTARVAAKWLGLFMLLWVVGPQVDAPLNNGVWGGPVMDVAGRVLGMAFQKSHAQTWMERYDEEGLDSFEPGEGSESDDGDESEGSDEDSVENVGYALPSLPAAEEPSSGRKTRTGEAPQATHRRRGWQPLAE